MHPSIVLLLCFAAIPFAQRVGVFSVVAIGCDSNRSSLSPVHISEISHGRMKRQVTKESSPEEASSESGRSGADVIPEDVTREKDTTEDSKGYSLSSLQNDLTASTIITESTSDTEAAELSSPVSSEDAPSPTEAKPEAGETTERSPSLQTTTLSTTQDGVTELTEPATSPVPVDVTSSEAETSSHQDLCKGHSRIACGPTVQCATDSDVKAVYCICDKDQVFDADIWGCIHKDSCKMSPCPVGDCVDNHGKTASSCDCSPPKYMGFKPDCSVEEDFQEYCEDKGAKPVVKGTSIDCACEEYQSALKTCAYKYCANFKYSCKEICEKGVLGKDDRCCQGWNNTNCSVEPDQTYCKPGYFFNDTTGSCIDACTSNHAADVCEHGCSTDPLSDTPFSCKCKSGETLQDDGITCGPRWKCTSKETDDCMQRGGQACEIEGTKPKCKCADDHILISGKCVGHCTREVEEMCMVPFASCNIVNNQERCLCLHPLVWNEHERQCELRTITYIATFKMVASTLTTYSTSGCDSEEDIERAMFMLYGRGNLLSSKVISCIDTYQVQLIFQRPVGDPVVRRILLCEHQEKDTCLFPPGLRIQRGSATVRLDNMCETSLKSFLSNFPNHYSCVRKDDGSYALRCTDSHRTVTKAPLKNLHVDICVGKPCNETCTERGKECLNEQCVCKFDHIPKDNGSCVEACDPNPCENGGVCTFKERAMYVCTCAPQYLGPHCEHENEELHASRKQVIIISSVLGSLLLVCLVLISAVLVRRRIRKSTAASSQLRNQSKLQHCYDGIQRASAVPEEENTAM